jgi:SAM-dependent methyltransferase
MAVAYRATFDCLWCGAGWTTRGPDDLEGWAQLCPTCLGRAGDNAFLRTRLRTGLAARAAAGDGARSGAGRATVTAVGSRGAAYSAFPDDWFLRRGPFERGAVHDAAWAAELDMVTRWLDGLPLEGRIVELAAGTGFFSPLLAERGELFAFDADGDALNLARDRLVAHRLRAHLHVADPWVPFPPGADPTPADALVVAFGLGRVRGAGLDAAVGSLRGRLGSRGRLAVIDLRPDPAGGPPPGTAWSWHDPALLEASVLRAGFTRVAMTTTGRFFLTLDAVAR